MRYLLNHPTLFESLPESFELVILPEDDPEMRLYNLDLLNQYGSGGKPIVFARLQSRRKAVAEMLAPSLFVPIAA